MRYLHLILFAVTLLLSHLSWAGTIYKCKNPQGALMYQEKPCTEESKPVSSWGSASGGPLVIDQERNGHYFIDGSINEHQLKFVVDTGATVVAIPQGMANAAGLTCQHKTMTHTANGLVQTCRTIIKKFKFGTYTLTNVEASIAPNLSMPLLGMNVLNQFRIEQDGGAMRVLMK